MSSTNVVLIEKTKPEWQKGKYNFVGGKIEEGESPVECMVREFFEETGVQTQISDWKYLGKMMREDNFECFVFVSEGEQFEAVKTMTEERVFLLEKGHFEGSIGFQRKFMSNLLMFYWYARSDDFRTYNAPFTIDYPPEVELLHHETLKV